MSLPDDESLYDAYEESTRFTYVDCIVTEARIVTEHCRAVTAELVRLIEERGDG